MKTDKILKELKKLFPNARCELDYRNDFELLIAVVLSAQTTDVKVNQVTVELFAKYPDAMTLAQAENEEVKRIIQPLGLANNKSKNIIALSRVLVEKYRGTVPDDIEKLITLPGVGRKTANVVLLEAFRIPAIPVDTHVARISKRLGFVAENDGVETIEKKLMEVLPQDKWIEAHQLFIHFGRYFCKAIKPSCGLCPLIKICTNEKKALD